MKVVVLHSGGLDSTVALYQALARWPGSGEVGTIGFDYEQRHRKELDAANAIHKLLKIPETLVEIRSWTGTGSYSAKKALGGSSQTDPFISVPEGHYADESMRATYVPNRNMIMLSIAASFALANKAGVVIYAAHSGDHAIYPDCRPEFVGDMNAVLERANYDPVIIYAPFLSMTKAEIVAEGARLGVPFELTWSCYKGGDRHCGKCGTCVERREAFELARVVDPTEYEV